MKEKKVLQKRILKMQMEYGDLKISYHELLNKVQVDCEKKLENDQNYSGIPDELKLAADQK